MTNHVDEGKGLYHKYKVHRMFDWDHKHDDCKFFVLDPLHDKAARSAVLIYAVTVRESNPRLARDLMDWIQGLEIDEEAADDDQPE